VNAKQRLHWTITSLKRRRSTVLDDEVEDSPAWLPPDESPEFSSPTFDNWERFGAPLVFDE